MKTTARVTVTLDIHLPDTWGAECTIDQITSQAKREALGMVRKQFPTRDDAVILDAKVRAYVIDEDETK